MFGGSGRGWKRRGFEKSLCSKKSVFTTTTTTDGAINERAQLVFPQLGIVNRICQFEALKSKDD